MCGGRSREFDVYGGLEWICWGMMNIRFVVVGIEEDASVIGEIKGRTGRQGGIQAI